MDRLQKEINKILTLANEYEGSAIEDCMAMFMLKRLGLTNQQISDLVGRPKKWITRRVTVAQALRKFHFNQLKEMFP